MISEKDLRAKLARVEALFRAASSPGERTAAAAAMGRLKGRLGRSDRSREPTIEMRFSLPDM